MSLPLRTKLFGIALVVSGGLYDLQMAVRGYGDLGGDASLGALVVTVGLVLTFAGLVGPAFRSSEE